VPTLTASEQRSVLDNVLTTIDAKFMTPGVDTKALRLRHEETVVRADTSEAFETAMNGLLKDLGASHSGFFHEAAPRAASRVAIAATFTKAHTRDGERWVFQDVHPGGVAAAAGIHPGDVLLAVGDKELVPPEATPFALGQCYALTVRRPDGSTATPTLKIPRSKDKRRPLVLPNQVVTASRADGGIAVVRVSMFPGVLGMDVARDISRAVADLSCDRLVIDLRGNTGGGIGCLRLMSLLCPDRRGVGYSLGRAAVLKGQPKERLPVFDRVPSSKLGALRLVPRFAFARGSVAVFTERLGAQAHHGRVVLLVNEHSASAAEMVAAFAAENGLATLVGTKTPGRLVAANSFKVGSGYRVVLPVAAYFTWKGTNLEGRGVEPDTPEPISPEALWRGEDNQLARAKAALDAHA
jgi:C-terminal processing protease CtpA/Prc